jgi:hypothetical protein
VEETLLSALRDGTFERAGQLTQASKVNGRRTLTISSGRCSEGTGEASLIVERVSQAGRNTQTKRVYDESIHATQLAAFERSVRQ